MLVATTAALAALATVADATAGTSDSGAPGATALAGEALQGDRPADDDRTFNLAINPVTLLVGWLDVEAQVAVSDRVAISGSFAAMAIGETTGMGAALTVPYYTDRVFSGGFIEPGVVAYRFDDDDPVIGPQLSVGWRWMSDAGVTLGVAVGGTVIGDVVLPQGYFRTGYAF